VTRSTTITADGRSWTVELHVGTSRHECPRIEVAPIDNPDDRRLYAYKLGSDWHAPGYTEPSLARAFDGALQQLDETN